MFCCRRIGGATHRDEGLLRRLVSLAIDTFSRFGGCVMNTGMDLTFEILATTDNQAAVGLLASSLQAEDAQIRRRGIGALLRRQDRSGALQVLRLWPALSDAELRTVQDYPGSMQTVISDVLAGSAEHPLWGAALDAVRMLNLTATLPAIIDRAEANVERMARGPLVATTIALCSSLGTAARRGQDLPGQRMPIVRRLADSVRRFEFHRCEGLCDAFLAVSRWTDTELRVLLDERSRGCRALAAPLLQSRLPAVVHLVAGFIRRRQIPEVVQQALRARSDDPFREHLLQSVGTEPSLNTLRNLRSLGPLACLADWPTLAGRTRPVQQAALLHAHTASCSDALQQLTVNLDVLAQGSSAADSAVAESLARCLPLDEEQLLRAAVRVAAAPERPTESDPLVQLLWRILQLLDHPNPAIAAALRGVLRPLHTDRFLERIESLRGVDYRPLGQLVRRINPAAAEEIADELRHPVLSRRLRAIEAGVACDLLDYLEPLLLHAAVHEHREAQLRAVAALGIARSAASLEMLQQLSQGPVGVIRDEASRVLAERLESARGE